MSYVKLCPTKLGILKILRIFGAVVSEKKIEM